MPKLNASSNQTAVPTDITNAELKLIGRVRLPHQVAKSEAEVRQWALTRKLTQEPTRELIKLRDPERASFNRASDFIAAERKRLGIAAEPFLEANPFRSKLWSPRGVSGVAYVGERFYIRYPASEARNEDQDLVDALHVHELTHATGVISLARTALETQPFRVARSGWTIIAPDSRIFFRALEEYTAATVESRALLAKGFVLERQPSYLAQQSASSYQILPKNPDIAEQLRVLDQVITKHSVTAGGASVDDSYHLARQRFPRISHQGGYSKLVKLLDQLADELYPEHPDCARAERFQDDCIRVQAGAGFALVTSRIQTLLGAQSLKFLATFGQYQDRVFSRSPELEFLRVFVRAGACTPDLRETLRYDVCKLHAELLDRASKPIPERDAREQIASCVRLAAELFKAKQPLQAIDMLSTENRPKQVLLREDVEILLASIAKYPEDRYRTVLAHLVFHGLTNRENIERIENKLWQIACRECRKLQSGQFDPDLCALERLPIRLINRLEPEQRIGGLLKVLPDLRTHQELDFWYYCAKLLEIEVDGNLMEKLNEQRRLAREARRSVRPPAMGAD